MDDLRLWLRLKLTKGLGERSIKKLYESFGSPEGILSARYEDLREIVGDGRARSLLKGNGVNDELVEKICKVTQRLGARVLTLGDDSYPVQLRDLPDPPPLLFVLGELEDTKFFGLVGTRKPTPYTLSFVEDFVKEAVGNGYAVVSGGANGVDAKAHLSAIENSGYTVCILGFGLLKARGGIFERLKRSSCALITEFLPHEPGDRHTFPKRNRLISALSEFILIPEAGRKSGSLITANYAVGMGKKVYVHIGIGRSPNWEGCYRLLREGKAELIRDHRDVFGDRAYEENPLIEFLRTPRSLEEIKAHLGLEEGEVLALLTRMELEGKVRRLGSFYSS